MCGIIGVAGNLQVVDEKIFKELLHADVVRGVHATGVALVSGIAREVKTHKRALPSPLFLELGSTSTALTRFIHHTAAIGHNRHATKGNSKDPEGAHPFTHGDITLVHNGSLTTHANLTEENFTVDSEAIAKAIDNEGIEIVGPKLRGAFVLVWIDAEKGTLNFLRNSERPLAIAWNTKTNRMWWASERGMLEWSINRDTFGRSPVDYDECFELPEGKWISIPLTSTSINIEGRTETDIDVSDSVYVYPTYTGYKGYETNPKPQNTSVIVRGNGSTGSNNTGVTDTSFGIVREREMRASATKILDQRGSENLLIRAFVSSIDMEPDSALLDERIGFFMLKWEAYSTLPGASGKLIGKMMEYPYCNILIHSIREDEYQTLYEQNDGMGSAYLVGINTPSPADVIVKVGNYLYYEDLNKFEVCLHKATLRKADLSDFNLPDSIDTTGGGNLTLTEKKFGPTDSLLRITLKDGSVVSPQGSAIFDYDSNNKLNKGERYTIHKIEEIKELESYVITILKDNSALSYNYEKFKQGILSARALASDDKASKIKETTDLGKWRVAVSNGCCHCKEVPSDFERAEDLTWIGDTFICGPCYFEQANRGY